MGGAASQAKKEAQGKVGKKDTAAEKKRKKEEAEAAAQ